MEQKKEKTKKSVAGIIGNIVFVVIFILVALILINVIASLGKGYTSFFGKASMTVLSNSMNGEYDEAKDLADDDMLNGSYKGNGKYSEGFSYTKGFKKGDLIFINILSAEEKQDLQVGDIITFYQTVEEQQILNSHRIVDFIRNAEDNTIATVVTHGDNNPDASVEMRPVEDIIGIYSGSKIGGLGGVIGFFNSSTGFLICVVVPSFLLVAYCIVTLIKSIRERNKEVSVIEIERRNLELANEKEKLKAELEAEKERMRAELLKELQAEKNGASPTDGENKPE